MESGERPARRRLDLGGLNSAQRALSREDAGASLLTHKSVPCVDPLKAKHLARRWRLAGWCRPCTGSEVTAQGRWLVQFIRPRQVLEMIGVSRTTLWRMVQAGTFPRPVRITERNCGFLLDTVEAWMKARAAGLAWEPASEPEASPIPARGGGAALTMTRRSAALQG
jgi:prophage regulatory protein